MVDEPIKEDAQPLRLEYQRGEDTNAQRTKGGIADAFSGLVGGVSCFFFVGFLIAGARSAMPTFKGFASVLLAGLSIVSVAMVVRCLGARAARQTPGSVYGVAFWIGAATITIGMALFFARG